MKRRDFLITSAGMAGTAIRGWGRSSHDSPARQKKLDRIAVMTLSFNSVLKTAVSSRMIRIERSISLMHLR